MSSQSKPVRRSTEEKLAIVDDLIALPFPEEEGQPWGGTSWGGPGYHLAVLGESQSFWDWPDLEVVRAAEAEMEADLALLAAELTARWGSPVEVDLWPYLGLVDWNDPDPNVAPKAPEPLSFLSNLAGSMQVWRLPSGERWLGLAIGQGDRELPFELLASVGAAAVLP